MDYYPDRYLDQMIEENIRLKRALEYQALVNHSYSHLAQAALDGKDLDDTQKNFVNRMKEDLKYD